MTEPTDPEIASTEIEKAVPTDVALKDLGAVLAQSGYFKDAREASQAIVKVLAGRELGLPPIASVIGIYFFDGKLTLSASLMASCVKKSGRYDYEVAQHTNEFCEIVFYEFVEKQEGKKRVKERQMLGTSRFSIDDAKRAGLSNKDNWRKYAINMCFARAMSNGVKWYAPDVFGGPAYTPDEFDLPILESGELDVDRLPRSRPQRVEPVDDGTPIEESKTKQIHILANEIEMSDDELHELAGVPSIKDLTKNAGADLLAELNKRRNRKRKEEAEAARSKVAVEKQAEENGNHDYVCWATNEQGWKCINKRSHSEASEHIWLAPKEETPQPETKVAYDAGDTDTSGSHQTSVSDSKVQEAPSENGGASDIPEQQEIST